VDLWGLVGPTDPVDLEIMAATVTNGDGIERAGIIQTPNMETMTTIMEEHPDEIEDADPKDPMTMKEQEDCLVAFRKGLVEH
jgi:hypothetical protein